MKLLLATFTARKDLNDSGIDGAASLEGFEPTSKVGRAADLDGLASLHEVQPAATGVWELAAAHMRRGGLPLLH
nr:hypothetical protein [Mesorhizobium sp. ESP-6-2]